MTSHPGQGKHDSLVLVVDDEADVAETTALMLRERGLEATTVTDPRSVSERVDERVACVVSDYQMPDMDGLELFEELREGSPHVPFILFTGHGSELIASEAIELGVDGYFQKGRSEQYDRLANRIEAAIEQSRAESALQKRRQQFEAVFENAFDGIFILDMEDAVIVDANPRACELLAYPYDELVGTSIEEIHPDDYEEYVELGRGLIESNEQRRVESLCYTHDGDVIPSDITAAPMEYEGQTFLLTIMRPQQVEPAEA